MFCAPGLFQDKQALQDFLKDVFHSLLHGRRHRKLSEASKLLYMSLLRHGGHLAHTAASNLLLGPCDSTVRAHAAQAGAFVPHALGLTRASLEAAVSVLKEYNLQETPCIISEDGEA